MVTELDSYPEQTLMKTLPDDNSSLLDLWSMHDELYHTHTSTWVVPHKSHLYVFQEKQKIDGKTQQTYIWPILKKSHRKKSGWWYFIQLEFFRHFSVDHISP